MCPPGHNRTFPEPRHQAGTVYREAAEADATLEFVIDDLLTGQFNNPVHVVAFNTSEGWARDVSEDVAREVLRRVTGRGLAASSRKFVETYVDEDELLRAENGVPIGRGRCRSRSKFSMAWRSMLRMELTAADLSVALRMVLTLEGIACRPKW